MLSASLNLLTVLATFDGCHRLPSLDGMLCVFRYAAIAVNVFAPDTRAASMCS